MITSNACHDQFRQTTFYEPAPASLIRVFGRGERVEGELGMTAAGSCAIAASAMINPWL